MKAQEYAERLLPYVHNNQDEKLADTMFDVLWDLLKEIEKLMKARNAKTYGALLAVVREIENKWHSILKRSGLNHQDEFLRSQFRLAATKALPKLAESLARLGWEYKED